MGRKRTVAGEKVWDPAGDTDGKPHWKCSRCGVPVGPSQGIQDLSDPEKPKRRCWPCDRDHMNNDPVETMELPARHRAPPLPERPGPPPPPAPAKPAAHPAPVPPKPAADPPPAPLKICHICDEQIPLGKEVKQDLDAPDVYYCPACDETEKTMAKENAADDGETLPESPKPDEKSNPPSQGDLF